MQFLHIHHTLIISGPSALVTSLPHLHFDIEAFPVNLRVHIKPDTLAFQRSLFRFLYDMILNARKLQLRANPLYQCKKQFLVLHDIGKDQIITDPCLLPSAARSFLRQERLGNFLCRCCRCP